MVTQSNRKSCLQLKDSNAHPTTLHAACYNGNLETVRTFLDNAIEYGIRLDAVGNLRLLPLHAAIILYSCRNQPIFIPKDSPQLLMDVRNKRVKVLQLLLNHPAIRTNTNYNARCAVDEMTALHLACYHGLPEVVDLLLNNAESHQIDVFPRDSDGMTPMDIAKEYQHGQHDDICSKFPNLV